MFSVTSILKEVEENGIWYSNIFFHDLSAHDSSVIVECLMSHESLLLGISSQGDYVLEKISENIKPLTRGDLKTLLSGDVRDRSSFAHFIGDVSEVKLLRKLPVKFSLELYSVDTKLQSAVDTVMSKTSWLYGMCIGLCIRKGNFVLLKDSTIEEAGCWGHNFR